MKFCSYKKKKRYDFNRMKINIKFYIIRTKGADVKWSDTELSISENFLYADTCLNFQLFRG